MRKDSADSEKSLLTVQEFVATLVRQRDMFRQLFEQLSGRRADATAFPSSSGAANGTPTASGHAADTSPADQQV